MNFGTKNKAESGNDPLDSKLAPEGTPTSDAKTAEEVGLDVDGIAKAHAAEDALKVAQTGGIADNTQAIYSSHPIQNYGIGPFQFDKAVLRFTGDEPEGRTVGDFEALLETMPAVDRAAIRRVDISAAEQLVADHMAAMGGATQGFDSSLGRDALERLHMVSPTVGRTDVAFAQMPGIDNNTPVIAQPAVDPEGETGLDQGPHTPPTE